VRSAPKNLKSETKSAILLKIVNPIIFIFFALYHASIVLAHLPNS